MLGVLSVAVAGIGAARAGGLGADLDTADLDTAGALEPCAAIAGCMDHTNELVADQLRAGGLGAEAYALALSPAFVRGTGGLVELSAQSLALPAGVAPAGVGVLPAVPRLGIGGVTGSHTRFGGGVALAAAVPTHDSEIGFGGGLRLGVAFGEPSGRRWVGFEADAGVGVVQGHLIDRPLDAVDALGLPVPIDGAGCGPTCLDQAVFGYAGLDSVLAYDIDETTVLGVRLGGVLHTARLDVATAQARWSWREIAPRLGLVAGYRPDPRAVVAIAVRLGVVPPPVTTERGRIPWTSALTFGWRFGAEVAPAPPPALPMGPPAPRPAAPPPPRYVPEVPIAEHPLVDCGPEQISTGKPPPIGLEGWCVTIVEPDMRVVKDGPYVGWHDPDHVRVRGQFSGDREVGEWTWYDRDGTPVAWGGYEEGLMEGAWRTLDASGKRGEGMYARGQEEGTWTYWYPNGSTSRGAFRNGSPDGTWVFYDGSGQVSGEILYRDGIILYQTLPP